MNDYKTYEQHYMRLIQICLAESAYMYSFLYN